MEENAVAIQFRKELESMCLKSLAIGGHTGHVKEEQSASKSTCVSFIEL